MLSAGFVSRVVVAGPTTHICRQWAADAARYGIDLEPNRPNSDWPELTDFHGVAVTYQTIAAGPDTAIRNGTSGSAASSFDALMGETSTWRGIERNALWRNLVGPGTRVVHTPEEQADHEARLVADLRLTAARYPADRTLKRPSASSPRRARASCGSGSPVTSIRAVSRPSARSSTTPRWGASPSTATRSSSPPTNCASWSTPPTRHRGRRTPGPRGRPRHADARRVATLHRFGSAQISSSFARAGLDSYRTVKNEKDRVRRRPLAQDSGIRNKRSPKAVRRAEFTVAITVLARSDRREEPSSATVRPPPRYSRFSL